MTDKPTGKRVERDARLHWVPIAKMHISDVAQRELKQYWVDRIAANLDLEQIGTPTVNERDEEFWIIDGQHRIEALKLWLGEGNWENQTIQCWAYAGLSEDDEAEMFLKLNNKLTVEAFEMFRVGVRAGRVEETDIDRIVRSQGLRISREGSDGAVRAVGTLRRVYRRSPKALHRTLRIIRDAYGDAGLEAIVIDGIGLVCNRYDGELDDEVAIARLSNARGGVNGLINKAETMRKQTGQSKAHCVAAATVQVINGARGKKLPSWWKNGDES